MYYADDFNVNSNTNTYQWRSKDLIRFAFGNTLINQVLEGNFRSECASFSSDALCTFPVHECTDDPDGESTIYNYYQMDEAGCYYVPASGGGGIFAVFFHTGYTFCCKFA